MSEKKSNTGPYFEIYSGGTRYVDDKEVPVLQVRKNRCGPTRTIYPGVFTINGKRERAMDCRGFTMCNFDLSTTSTIPVLTHYGESQCDGDTESCFSSNPDDDSNTVEFSRVINFDISEEQ